MGDRDNDLRETRAEKVSEFERAYVEALLAADEVAAEIVIREAMDAKLTVTEIDEQIIAPALWRVGELWEQGMISIADEHVATEISLRVLALQREAQRVVQARRGRRVMLAAPAGEHHVIALRMVGNLLSEAGYWIVMLGADVPAHALVDCVKRHQPDVICLSLTMPLGAPQMLRAIDQVTDAWPAARFVVGGRAVSGRLQSQPSIDICQRVSQAVETVDASIKDAGLN